ncbi:MAG TPA: hypothetical protein VD861_17505, partial [Pyrinomonadaceae bacterium]|nr:hypothetical protein [Pyrinomonadaceae bacterium]
MRDEEGRKAEGGRQKAEGVEQLNELGPPPSSFSSFIPHPSSLIPKLRRALRGDVGARYLALEAWRRSRARGARRRERASLEKLAQRPARLRAEFSRMSPPELLDHFRNRTDPKFLPGSDALSHASPELQRTLFPSETAALIERAARVADE